MAVLQAKRNKGKNNNNKSEPQLQMNAQSLLFLLLQLMLLCTLLYVDVVRAAELPAELMLEGVSLLKSMEYAQQKQQQHPHSISQKSHMLHEQQTKRFPFDTVNAGSSDVDIDTMQLPEMSPADIARFERELFLQSAIDETSLMSDDVELPLEPNSMEQHADLMERAIDYKQHQPTAMWSQQHGSSSSSNQQGGDGRKASSTFLKLRHPHHLQQQQQQQQQPHQPQQQHSHQYQHPKYHQKQHLSGSDTTSANSVTLAPPPLPVAAPQRHCAIEIATKLTGVCQAMAPVGTACVAGDYMDVYNQDCM